ncbi:Cap15 family cyclic dinucleotide receptor domain-containing protein [Jatrophihabitans fulvus]
MAYAVVLYLSGVHLQDGWRKAVGYLPTLATLALALWDGYAWHLPGIQRLSKRPWVAGTWRATLSPTSASHIPTGGNRGPVEAYVIIKQSFWFTSVRQYTAESRSESIASVWAESGGEYRLIFMYGNRPKQQLESRSRPHLGTSSLDVVGLRPMTMAGEYFTDRYTKGDITLAFVDRQTGLGDFTSIQTHVAGS